MTYPSVHTIEGSEIQERIAECVATLVDRSKSPDSAGLIEEARSLIDWTKRSGLEHCLADLILKPIEIGLSERCGDGDGSRIYNRFLRALRDAAAASAGHRPTPSTNGHLRDGAPSHDGSPGPRREMTDGMVLWGAANAWQRAIRHALAPTNLTHVQFMLLRSLAHPSLAQTTVTQAMLARQSGVDEMMASQVLRTLESKGLIRRENHLRDSRAKVVALTEVGVELLFHAILLAEKAEREFFDPIKSDRATVAAALEKLLPHA